MKCIILCAGYATRLYPLTKNKAKPLLPIKGKPLIEYIIDKVKEIKDITEIIIVSNSKFYNEFTTWKNNFSSNIPITILNDGSTENENRLGAIKDIHFAIKQEDTLILAGDNLFEFSLKDFYNFYKQKQTSITAAFDTKNIEIVRNRHGVIILDNEKIIDFQEKPSNPKSTIKSIACYILTKKDIQLLDLYIKEGNNTDAPGFFLEWLCKKTNIHAFVTLKPIYDIGNLESYKKADSIFRL